MYYRYNEIHIGQSMSNSSLIGYNSLVVNYRHNKRSCDINTDGMNLMYCRQPLVESCLYFGTLLPYNKIRS